MTGIWEKISDNWDYAHATYTAIRMKSKMIVVASRVWRLKLPWNNILGSIILNKCCFKRAIGGRAV